MTPTEQDAIYRLMRIPPTSLAERQARVDRFEREYPFMRKVVDNTDSDSLLTMIAFAALRRLCEHGLAHAPGLFDAERGPFFCALCDYVDALGMRPDAFTLAQFEERLLFICETFTISYSLPMSIAETKH